jgi:hypothetical protein
VAIDAVVGEVQLATDEPLGERQLPLERLVERLVPTDALAGELFPEGDVVALSLFVERRLGIGPGGESRVGRKDALLGEKVLDLRLRHRARQGLGHCFLSSLVCADATAAFGFGR